MPAVQMRFDGLLQRAVETVPEREALVFIAGGERPALRLTYRELSRLVERTVRSLLNSDVRRGDAIAVYASNRPEFVLLQFACSQIGAAAVPVNPLYGADELAYVLARAGVRICFAADRHRDLPLWQTLTSVAERLDRLESCVALSPVGGGAADWDGWLASGAATADAAVESARLAALPSDTCQIEFTSGTTGRPESGRTLERGARQRRPLHRLSGGTGGRLPVSACDALLSRRRQHHGDGGHRGVPGHADLPADVQSGSALRGA